MEREVLEFDVQFVGAGPAGLAGAIHLANLIERHDAGDRRGRAGQRARRGHDRGAREVGDGRRARHLGRGAWTRARCAS